MHIYYSTALRTFRRESSQLVSVYSERPQLVHIHNELSLFTTIPSEYYCPLHGELLQLVRIQSGLSLLVITLIIELSILVCVHRGLSLLSPIHSEL
jgi:hypothetical protein